MGDGGVGVGVAAGLGVAAGFLAIAGASAWRLPWCFVLLRGRLARRRAGRRRQRVCADAPADANRLQQAREDRYRTQESHFRRYPCPARDFSKRCGVRLLDRLFDLDHAALGPRGSAQMKSPTRTKSAPAAANSPASSRETAKPTHGGSNNSSHHCRRSAIASLEGRSPLASGRRTARNPHRLRPRPSNLAGWRVRRRRRCGRVSATAWRLPWPLTRSDARHRRRHAPPARHGHPAAARRRHPGRGAPAP